MWPFRKRQPQVESAMPTRAEILTAATLGPDTDAWRPTQFAQPWMYDRSTLPRTERQDAPMTDHGPAVDKLIDASLTQPIPPGDSGVHAMADSQPLRNPCPTCSGTGLDTCPQCLRHGDGACPDCFGTGHVMTTSDLLRHSLGLLGDDPAAHHQLAAKFYRRLLDAAPGLISLFPADLTDPTSDGKGKKQRDKLLTALITLGQTYDPDHPDSEDMQALATHLEMFGRSHSNFARPGGRARPASVPEYAAVFNVLIGTLHRALGAAWAPAFDEAWEEAYDHAARGMIASAWSFGSTHPRTVRSSDYGKAAADAEHAQRLADRESR